MQLGEIVEAAIAQVVSLSKVHELPDANKNFVRLMVNKGYHVIERKALWKFSEAEAEISAVQGERYCPDLPSDLSVPVGIWSPRMGRPLGYHDERQRFFSPKEQGTVQYYGIWEGELSWYPLPFYDEVFTLRYYAKWEDLVEDTDTPRIPETWHDLLIDYASGWLAMRLPATGERFLTHSRAQPFLDTFELRLEEMANSDLVMKTWDEVPNYGFEEHVLGLGEW